jgi:hypothetical protein
VLVGVKFTKKALIWLTSILTTRTTRTRRRKEEEQQQQSNKPLELRSRVKSFTSDEDMWKALF